MSKADDLERVTAFRERFVTYANFVTEKVHGLGYVEQPSKRDQAHIGQEQTWLRQEYGAIQRTISRFGTAKAMQFGMVMSYDVVRDTIGMPTHPSYGEMASLAVGHLDTIIGKLRAEVESQRPVSMDDVYRATSPVFWLAKIIDAIRRLLGTTRGRIVAAVSAGLLALIGAFAQAWFAKLLGP